VALKQIDKRGYSDVEATTAQGVVLLRMGYQADEFRRWFVESACLIQFTDGRAGIVAIEYGDEPIHRLKGTPNGVVHAIP
jgi:hypothetical protein